MKLISHNADSAPQPVGGYAQAIAVHNAGCLLFISGQIPETFDGLVPNDFISQARLVWANLIAQLEAANMSVENLVKVTIFLSARRYADENRQVREEFLGAHAPALTVLIVGIFDERWLLEIEAVAAA